MRSKSNGRVGIGKVVAESILAYFSDDDNQELFDKFAKFGLTPVPSNLVRSPLIKECLANIECKVIDIVKKHNIVVLEAVAAYIDVARKEKRTIHAVGDGTFIVDGRKLDRKKMMAAKLPPGV